MAWLREPEIPIQKGSREFYIALDIDGTVLLSLTANPPAGDADPVWLLVHLQPKNAVAKASLRQD